ncbi:hypothetical protein G3T14_17615 [Methylobacterium sp. BTF04]|uniref:hypothetical protein n=1 Tax=Methylobacterium sp. BTF04 TaxID=2708300 RepID=UPI0013D7ED92|nr:hypothetical protein [Methylobacterium sp. BTF04]NEU13932.1 hypothetical protein [Methylobacterium sp. BTF04]
MKLSEVSRAKDLVDQRRKLVVAYVDVGLQDDVYVPYGFAHHRVTVFGYVVDEPMLEALRKATRDEILRRVDQCDGELAKLGVEIDGIEIEIKREESLRRTVEVEEKAA